MPRVGTVIETSGEFAMIASSKRGICDGCFSLEYPVPIDTEEQLPQLSLFRAVEDEPVED